MAVGDTPQLNDPLPKDAVYWKRLDALLSVALDMPVADREQWLGTLPPSDEPFLQTLRDLLAKALLDSSGFMQSAAAFSGVGIDGEAEDVPGEEIGPYRLISRLGVGGMATVWVAERIDGAMQRRVALKLPNAVWMPGLVARMHRERDILSALEHPCIARLYDAGATEAGRPYLAMELVQGRDIGSYCREEALPTAKRLELFLQVLRAVAHAHARLVVHRDLKPGNILVTHEGEVRLLDFGIATILEEASSLSTGAALTSAVTKAAGRALTLDYASPEQIRGERITVASDVFSLGVVLFELLTGQRPYTLRRVSAGAIEDAILEQEAPRASSRADGGTGRALKGDLDAIIGKALKKDKADRYLSVEALAGDVERYLAGQPVQAQPDSTGYRLHKFLGRHRAGAAASSVALFAVLAGASVAIWQARIARIEAERADTVKQFIASTFREAVPRTGVGGEVLATDLLKAAASRVQTEMSANPRAAAELGIIIGDSFSSLGQPDGGKAILQFAIPLAVRELGPAHVLTLRARVQLARITMQSEPSRAVAMQEAIIQDARPQLPGSAQALADALDDKGFLLTRGGRGEEALGVLREALRVADAHLGADSETAILVRGQIVNTLGMLGRQVERLAFATESVQHAQRVLGDHRPSVALINAERNYAAALRGNDRPSDAIPLLRQVVSDQHKLDAAQTGRVRYGLHELGLALAAAGEVAEALTVQREVVALEAVNNRYESENRVVAYEPLVSTLLMARREREAASMMQESAQVQSRIGSERPRHAVARLLNEARVLALQGDVAGADRRAALAREHEGATALQRVEALELAAFNARVHGRLLRALELIDQAMAIDLPPTGSLARRASLLAEHAAIHLDMGRDSEAKRSLDDCRKSFEGAQVRPGVRTGLCLTGQVRLHLRTGDRAAQRQALRELTSLAGEWQRVNPQSAWYGETLFWCAELQSSLGETLLARQYRDQSRALLIRSTLPMHRRLAARGA